MTTTLEMMKVGLKHPVVRLEMGLKFAVMRKRKQRKYTLFFKLLCINFFKNPPILELKNVILHLVTIPLIQSKRKAKVVHKNKTKCTFAASVAMKMINSIKL